SSSGRRQLAAHWRSCPPSKRIMCSAKSREAYRSGPRTSSSTQQPAGVGLRLRLGGPLPVEVPPGPLETCPPVERARRRVGFLDLQEDAAEPAILRGLGQPRQDAAGEALPPAFGGRAHPVHAGPAVPEGDDADGERNALVADRAEPVVGRPGEQ